MADGLSEEQLREAANEAGITPHALRQALAERDDASLARLGPPGSGTVQGAVAMEQREAMAAVRKSIERSSHRDGHAQGDERYDIVDEDEGLTYRITARGEGEGLSLVRIDVDTTAGRGALALAAAGTAGVSLSVVAVGWLFSWLTMTFAGVALGVIGGLWIARNAMALAHARKQGEAFAAQALGEAQSAASGDRGDVLP
jgi:hypothetical protein